MSSRTYSVAMSTQIHDALQGHLLRRDGQEDLCFAIWHPSRGTRRTTALISDLILPQTGDRKVHGNVSFLPAYFERALGVAMKAGAGLVLLHSHPGGTAWQGMSLDDIRAEEGNAGAVLGATSLPFVGLTIAGDGGWSARFWEKTAPHRFRRMDCTHVRVAGDKLRLTYNDGLIPRSAFREQLRRTTSSWGPGVQADLGRLHFGIVGAGSVGAIIAEGLARTGISRLTLIDFDGIEPHNRDRLLHASEAAAQARVSKVRNLEKALRDSATAEDFRVTTVEYGVGEEEGYRHALDCDVLFSCVDRPLGRSILNFIAYAHLIPVVDGGILVQRTPKKLLKGAEWRAHVAAPGRRCLSCLGQFDPGLVAADRAGQLDDLSYIERLPENHVIRQNENVFAFSLGAAALQLNQALAMIVAPLDVADPGAQLYHFTTGEIDIERKRQCDATCSYPGLTALGEDTGLVVTAESKTAESARESRAILAKTESGRDSSPLSKLRRFVARLFER